MAVIELDDVSKEFVHHRKIGRLRRERVRTRAVDGITLSIDPDARSDTARPIAGINRRASFWAGFGRETRRNPAQNTVRRLRGKRLTRS